MVALKLQQSATALALLIGSAQALVQTYCSSQNTGSDYTPVNWPWQSNGYCHDICNADYAFAIVQGLNCWCSNYLPNDQTSVSDCSAPCPGYGDLEHCGNESEGLFGYVVMENVAPSSSADAPSPATTRQSSAQPTSPAATNAPSPVTSIQVITVSGAPVTKTVTTTPTSNNNGGSNQADSDSGLSTGAIAGIAVGVIGGLAALAVAAFLLWRRRRDSKDGRGDPKKPKRTTSMLSKTGLLSRGRAPSMGERNDDPFNPYNAAGSNSARHSMLFGAIGHDNVVVQPASPLGSSHGGSADLERRSSRPMLYDQRLNPTALFANAEANGSRVSMQDQHDYSRTLGVTNPDPRPSFESRISRG